MWTALLETAVRHRETYRQRDIIGNYASTATELVLKVWWIRLHVGLHTDITPHPTHSQSPYSHSMAHMVGPPSLSDCSLRSTVSTQGLRKVELSCTICTCDRAAGLLTHPADTYKCIRGRHSLSLCGLHCSRLTQRDLSSERHHRELCEHGYWATEDPEGVELLDSTVEWYWFNEISMKYQQ